MSDHEREAVEHLRGCWALQGASSIMAYRRYMSDHPAAPSTSALKTLYGSWSRAISGARLKPSPHRGRPAGAVLFSDELVAGLLRRCAESLGHPPGIREYERWRDEMTTLLGTRIPGSAILRRRYGGWGRALAAADLSPRS